MAQNAQIITLKQLAEHAAADSLWIAVHGHVYDLTAFRSDHPGGTEALESCAGTDGTESYEYAGHSKSNMTKMRQYCIGKLEGAVSFDAELSQAKSNVAVVVKSKPDQSTGWHKPAIFTAVASALSLLYYWKADFSVSMSLIGDSVNPALDVNRAFWAGLALASTLACVAARYFHKMFLATLDYQNEVFSFPATIPKKSRR